MSGTRFRCCACCNGIAKGDHVGHGGTIEKDDHDLPCESCRDDKRIEQLVREAEARGAAAERTRLTASVQGVCDAYQRWDGKAENAGECSAALSNLRAALATDEEQP